ncbi:MAG: lactate utilization protein C [Micropruina sp.]
MLGRVRAALVDVPRSTPEADVEVVWAYGQPTAMDDVVAVFVERVEDYRAVVVRCSAAELPAQIVTELRATGARSVVLPSGVPAAWAAACAGAGLTVVSDEPQLSHDALNRVDAVLTAAAVGMAETGTIVLDHRADQGRRALSLVPDRHVCVIRADQVVTDVPEGVARLQESIAEGLPLTWISGPSATSDIELSRVEGVHGPRDLHVIVVG